MERMTMVGERWSYNELSQHFFTLHQAIAHRGESMLPVFSGDWSVLLRLPHRVVKDVIEAHFRELRQAYGRKIQVVRYKRRGCRAMRGYLLPFQAMVQLLPYFGEASATLMHLPEFLYMYF